MENMTNGVEILRTHNPELSISDMNAKPYVIQIRGKLKNSVKKTMKTGDKQSTDPKDYLFRLTAKSRNEEIQKELGSSKYFNAAFKNAEGISEVTVAGKTRKGFRGDTKPKFRPINQNQQPELFAMIEEAIDKTEYTVRPLDAKKQLVIELDPVAYGKIVTVSTPKYYMTQRDEETNKMEIMKTRKYDGKTGTYPLKENVLSNVSMFILETELEYGADILGKEIENVVVGWETGETTTTKQTVKGGETIIKTNKEEPKITEEGDVEEEDLTEEKLEEQIRKEEEEENDEEQ